ncbi:serine/threonine-protein kinase [Hyalangium rubrum]|uniref:Protein kinase n=1 Tax=Hyalangium rubrum TaxID=3103134 RepID=A0ABU5GZ60_9BACT|nr:protein kinase [Hyalangium sp. s54d21]MDY7226478.1 protein kinase [Hyalangium sp. s54d21]
MPRHLAWATGSEGRGEATMGTYRLIQKLATGGMAEVFLGKVVGVEGFEKPVAIKRILPAYAQDSAFVELFLREARLSVVLQHANLVQVLDLGISQGQYHMVLEFVDGENLRALLAAARSRRACLGLREVCLIVQQVADALAHAHSRTDAFGASLDIVHRDINPSNVMVSRNGEVKLTDFGIAGLTHASLGARAGALRGKIRYLSPEQARSEPVDQRSDLFLLGLLLYELLAGRQLLDGTERQVLHQLGSFNERTLEPIPGVPTALWLILTRALSASLDNRFSTAREFSEALQDFLFHHRLRVSQYDIASLFARLLPERRSPLEQLHRTAGEELCLNESAPRARPVFPPGLRLRQPAPSLSAPERGAERMVFADDLLHALSEQTGLPHITEEKLQRMPVPEELIRVVPLALCERLCAVPLMQWGQALYCAVLDARDQPVLEALRQASRSGTAYGMFATESAIRRAIRRFYGLPENEAGTLEPSLLRERLLRLTEGQ